MAIRLPAVSLDAVNSFATVRHGLRGPGLRSARDVLRDIIGIQGEAPGCYLSTGMRTGRFRACDLDDELYDRRRAVRVRAMRGELFAVALERLPMVFQATREQCARPLERQLKGWGVSGARYRRLAAAVEWQLEHECMTLKELHRELPRCGPTAANLLPAVIELMCAEGRLVRTRAGGNGRSLVAAYTSAAHWLPDVDLESMPQAGARAQLASLYFDAHGPATRADFEWWSGLTSAQANAAIDTIAHELSPIEIQGLRDEYLMSRRWLGALVDTEASAPDVVSLLPLGDPCMSAHTDRGYRGHGLSRDDQRVVFDDSGRPISVVLLGGRIGGVWRFREVPDGVIFEVALLDEQSHGVWSALRRECEQLVHNAGMGQARLLARRTPPSAFVDVWAEFLPPAIER